MSQIKQFTVASVAVNDSGKEGGPSNQITLEAPTGLEAETNEFSVVQERNGVVPAEYEQRI